MLNLTFHFTTFLGKREGFSDSGRFCFHALKRDRHFWQSLYNKNGKEAPEITVRAVRSRYLPEAG